MIVSSLDWIVTVARIVYGSRWRLSLVSELRRDEDDAARRAASEVAAAFDDERPAEPVAAASRLRPVGASVRTAVRDAILRHLRTRPVANADLVMITDTCLGPRPLAMPDEAGASLRGVREFVEMRLGGTGARTEPDIVVPLTLGAMIVDIDRRIATASGELREVCDGMLAMTLRRHALAATIAKLVLTDGEERPPPVAGDARRPPPAPAPPPPGPFRVALPQPARRLASA